MSRASWRRARLAVLEQAAVDAEALGIPVVRGTATATVLGPFWLAHPSVCRSCGRDVLWIRPERLPDEGPLCEVGCTPRRAKALAAERARLAIEAAAEPARLARCPRPDKELWRTREGAQEVIEAMRANGAPHSLDLHAYECACGVWHVGNRMKAPEPQKWASAYEGAS